VLRISPAGSKSSFDTHTYSLAAAAHVTPITNSLIYYTKNGRKRAAKEEIVLAVTFLNLKRREMARAGLRLYVIHGQKKPA
jgi:hypothetical protein